MASFLLVFHSVLIFAQNPVVSGQVQPVPQADIGPGVQALPRMVTGPGVTASAAAKLNANFVKQDAEAASDMVDCRKSLEESWKNDKPSPGRSSADAYQRDVAVTMKGPHYLSLQVRESDYCGGPHPNVNFTYLVFDLTSWQKVNWSKLLPQGAKETDVGIVWPWLRHRAAREADKDCRSAFIPESEIEPTTFDLWLDAKRGVVIALPNFPHVIQACANDIVIKANEAAKLGIAAALVSALRAAHAETVASKSSGVQ